MLEVEPANPLLPPGYLWSWNLIAALVVLLALAAIVSVVLSKRCTVPTKLLWILVIALLPVLGSVLWFGWGIRARPDRAY